MWLVQSIVACCFVLFRSNQNCGRLVFVRVVVMSHAIFLLNTKDTRETYETMIALASTPSSIVAAAIDD